MKIDTSNWDKVTLGNVAQSLTTATKDPLSEGFERYVGLEHIEPGNIHIKSWGNVADGTTFTRVFRKGQVLFGKRRAYQKKAAMAEFDGICSGDILVCEAIKDVVVPELLPFIVQSDRFFEYAIKTSAGSLSPRTKFKDLAKFPLRLPKLDKQKPIAVLLWSIDKGIQKNIVLYQSLKILKASMTKILFTKAVGNTITLGDLCVDKPSYGATASAVELKPDKPRYIRITDISEEGDLLHSEVRGIGAAEFSKYRLEDGDLLIARTAAVGRAFVYRSNYGDCVYAGYLIKFRLDRKKALPEYIFCYLQSPIFQNWIRKTTHTGLQANINAREYSGHLIPVPSLETQRQILEKINKLKVLEQSVRDQIKALKEIQKQILNQLFG